MNKTERIAELLEGIAEWDDDDDAMAELGGIYYAAGQYEEARKYNEMAAELGNDWAITNLGYLYQYGRLGQQDVEKAFYCFSEGAAMGNVNALYKVGDSYYWGDFVKQDRRIAFRYYEAAYSALENTFGNQCRAEICYRLALCNHKGNGTEKNNLTALKMINDAHTWNYIAEECDAYAWQSLRPKIEPLRIDIVSELDDERKHVD